MRLALFALLSALLIATAAGATPGQVLYVQENEVDVREAPSRGALVLLQLKEGAKLLEFERRGAWIRVGLHYAIGKDGWVLDSHLGPYPPGAAFPPPSTKPSGAPGAPPTGYTLEERATEFLIEVSGDPAVAFRGDCEIVTHAGEIVRAQLRDLIPKSYTVEAEAIACTVQKRDAFGWLKVGLFAGEDLVALMDTRAAFNWVLVRSDGPWGAAAGVRGVQRLISFTTRTTRPREQLVPALRNPVPALGNTVPGFTSSPVPALR